MSEFVWLKNYRQLKSVSRTLCLLYSTYARCLDKSELPILCKERNLPSNKEVVDLNVRFPDPKRLVFAILRPQLTVSPSSCPLLVLRPKLGGLLWRAELFVRWPRAFRVVGLSVNQRDAQRNAYLSACSIFESIGLIRDGKVTPFLDYVCCELRKQAKAFPVAFKVQMISTLSASHGDLWRCQLRLKWPTCLHVESLGVSEADARNNAALLATVKLKELGMLDKNNQCRVHRPVHSIDRPDLELFVDSSGVGVGALVRDCSHRAASWFQEPWPTAMKELSSLAKPSQCLFLETLSVVLAVVTWRNLFAGQRVMIHSDNSGAVCFLKGNRSTWSSSDPFAYLYELFLLTVQRYDITVSLRHISGSSNTEADLLSRTCSASPGTQAIHRDLRVRTASSNLLRVVRSVRRDVHSNRVLDLLARTSPTNWPFLLERVSI